MADPKIRIPIELPAGDLSGAEQAQEEIKATAEAAAAANEAEAARIRQADEDVAEARRRQSQRRIEDLEAEALAEKRAAEEARTALAARAAAGAAVALVARQAMAEAQQAIAAAREAGIELDASATAFEATLRLIQNPVGELIELVTGFNSEMRELAASQQRAAAAEALYLRTLKERQEELNAARQKGLDVQQTLALQAINAQTAAYRRQREEIEAIAKAEEARLRAQEAAAVAAGTLDPNQAAANQAGRDAARQSAQIDQRVVDAERAFDAADAALQQATSRLADTAGQAAAVRDAAAAAVAEAQAARDAAAADLESIQLQAQAQRAELTATFQAELQGTADASRKAVADAAREAKAELEAAAQEEGRNFAAGGREALKILTDALADGVISKEELAAVLQAVQQAKNSANLLTEGINDRFSELDLSLKAALANERSLLESQRQLRQEFEGLRAEIQANR